MMKKTLGELAALIPGAKLTGKAETEITSIEHDSRKVEKDALFACVVGATVDGHNYIPQVQEKGAAALLTEREDLQAPAGMAVLVVPKMHEALEKIVPYFYDYPAQKMRVIGITGTSGKTTTSYLTRAILRQAGYKVGLIGTIRIMIEEEVLPVHNTTPDVVDLQQTLYKMQQKGMDYVVMEVSSHALAQNRVTGCEFDTAIFTNLSQDHLDYHKTLENYREAKALLFAHLSDGDNKKKNKTAVVNVDDAAGKAMLAKADCRQLTYGIENKASLQASAIEVKPLGTKCTINTEAGSLELNLQVTGIFNVYNVMAAAGAAMAEGISLADIKAALENFQSVPGRFELVRAGQDFAVIVDYAHKPDALENILQTARKFAKKRIITVFGCGGDRDKTKRPIMGRIAAELSDYVIATSDNPRSEKPEAILEQVEEGVKAAVGNKPYEKIVDRREAIFRAVEIAEAEDIVVIAGKGHEDYQILSDRTIHFDDREVAREAIGRKLQ